jgi:hypothetical protein
VIWVSAVLRDTSAMRGASVGRVVVIVIPEER